MSNRGAQKVTYSDHEDDTIRAHYGRENADVLGERIGRSEWSVKRRARMLGLARTRGAPASVDRPPSAHRPAPGKLSAYTAFNYTPSHASEPVAPLRDRVLRVLSFDDASTQGLATLLDAKELLVAQVLASMEHEGVVVAGPMPEAGRRAQRWRVREVQPSSRDLKLAAGVKLEEAA